MLCVTTPAWRVADLLPVSVYSSWMTKMCDCLGWHSQVSRVTEVFLNAQIQVHTCVMLCEMNLNVTIPEFTLG